MSFHEVAISIRAINEASPEFHRISVDVSTMAAEVRASGAVMTSSFEAASVEARSMGAEVVVAAEEVSFSLSHAGEEAEEMTSKIELSGAAVREATRDLTTLGMGAVAIGRLGEQFGVLNKEQSGWMTTLGMSLTAIGGVVRAIQVLSSVTSVATAIQNALNISHATFLALTGVGIAVVISAAAAMAYFASQMNAATSSVERYNAAAAETPGYTRSIRRAGEEEELRRRGIE